MTKIDKIRKQLGLDNSVLIECTSKELGFDVYDYDLENPKRVMYITDSDLERASEDSQFQLKFYKQISKNIYEISN